MQKPGARDFVGVCAQYYLLFKINSRSCMPENNTAENFIDEQHKTITYLFYTLLVLYNEILPDCVNLLAYKLYTFYYLII